jgi:hypothetical protein
MRIASLTLIGTSALLLLGVSACGEEDSKTQLNPEGPPMVRQVFMDERVQVDTDGDGTPDSERTRTQMAFGSHPDISLDDDPADGVANAIALNNKIRIVIDEILDGSTLEQIGCADGTFVDIPKGTDPDDIAECAGVDRRNCTAVCTQIGPDNQAVGVLDENEDGAADQFRFKDDVLAIVCDGQEMPLLLDGLNKTFWNPSGNQQIPAGSIGVAGLGPAIVVIPEGLRTGASCVIDIDDSVVDKDGESLCAPPGGDVTKACPGNGDTSLIEFGTQIFALLGAAPGDGQQFVRLDAQVLLQFNLDVDTASIMDNVSISDETGIVAATIMAQMSDGAIISVAVDGDMTPETDYTVNVTGGANGLKEIFGGGLAEDIELTFTTCLAEGSVCEANSNCCEGTCEDPGDGTTVCTAPPPMPDADIPDADTTDADIPDAGTPDAV